MRAGRCRAVACQLSAYRDGELPVAEQIAIEAHVRACPDCAAAVADFEAVGAELRRVAAPGFDHQRLAGLAATVVSRVKAEREQSISGLTRRAFEDMHFVWAALGAAGATAACVAIVFAIFYYATHERPDSLGGVMAQMSLPAGSNENPLQVDGRIHLPSATDGDAFPEAALPGEDESVFALAAVLTREGRIANLELLHAEARSGNRRSQQRETEILTLLDSISKARFEPARYGNAPVAVNMVWLYTQLTVRGKAPETASPPARSISSLAPPASLSA
jgi:hypothetical protein